MVLQPEVGQLVLVKRPDIGSLDRHGAGVGPQDAGDHAEQRGLAAAGGADDEQHLAEICVKGGVIYSDSLGVAFSKPFDQTRCRNRYVSHLDY